MPESKRLSERILLAASVGWNPSQNTYSVALVHVPTDLGLHSIDVSSNPVPQHALLASANPEHYIIKNKTQMLILVTHNQIV